MLLLLVLLHEEYKSPDMLDHAKTKTTHVASVIVTKHILLKNHFYQLMMIKGYVSVLLQVLIPSFRLWNNSVHVYECSPFWVGIYTICI